MRRRRIFLRRGRFCGAEGICLAFCVAEFAARKILRRDRCVAEDSFSPQFRPNSDAISPQIRLNSAADPSDFRPIFASISPDFRPNFAADLSGYGDLSGKISLNHLRQIWRKMRKSPPRQICLRHKRSRDREKARQITSGDLSRVDRSTSRSLWIKIAKSPPRQICVHRPLDLEKNAQVTSRCDPSRAEGERLRRGEETHPRRSLTDPNLLKSRRNGMFGSCAIALRWGLDSQAIAILRAGPPGNPGGNLPSPISI